LGMNEVTGHTKCSGGTACAAEIVFELMPGGKLIFSLCLREHIFRIGAR
jgi:hypothetical protein